MIWTPERIARLRELIEGGATYQAAGVELGCGKNAAIGKARREGITVLPGAEPSNVWQRVRWAEVEMMQRETKQSTVCPFPEPGRCVWPEGHPKEAGFHFCGERIDRMGVSYCAEHRLVAYQRVRREDAAA
jgi:GcrA cell cycle regulator